MIADRLKALERRLAQDELTPRSGWQRAGRFFLRRSTPSSLDELRALDAQLDAAGIHTSADAKLLQQLSVTKARAGALAKGLVARAEACVTAFEAAMERFDDERAEGTVTPSQRRALEADLLRLSRVVKVALIFSQTTRPPFELFPAADVGEKVKVQSPRLALAQFVAERARAEVMDVQAKRRDLDFAYELVLRLGVDTSDDRAQARRLRVELSAARDRARAAAQVRSFDELLRHLRHSARADPLLAWRSVRALYERAVESGQAELAEAAFSAATALVPPRDLRAAVERSELRADAGWKPLAASELEALSSHARAALDDQLTAKLTQVAYALDDDRRRALELAKGAGRYFDVEEALAEEVTEVSTSPRRPRHRRVPYPTQLMSYEPASGLEELPHFVLDRPGALVLDLASGRQMVRSYVEPAPAPTPKAIKQTAVRVYVLDASGSMFGARARFRDALLISELNAIRVKAAAGLHFDPLYFCFFNDRPTELIRVDSGEQANRHISALFETSRAEGQTDISLALGLAFDSITQAKGRDPFLARATVVLVTDGEDGIDVELIERARRPHAGLQISFSFISIGQENSDLRELVVRQQQAKERAFYHHLSDPELALARTEFDSAWRTLLPADPVVEGDALERLVPHLEALEAIALRLPARPIESTQQFDTLFPELTVAAGGIKHQTVISCLDAVGEALALAPMERRQREAVTLLLHLLGLFGVSVPEYSALLSKPDASLCEAVARIRLVC